MLRPDGRVTLIDFGVARSAITAGGTAIGTGGYAAPEQYQGLADALSDVYGLAATLHHLLTGRDPTRQPPFAFPAVRTLVPTLSSQTEEALAQALHLVSDRRFASIDELEYALRATPPISSPYISSTLLPRVPQVDVPKKEDEGHAPTPPGVDSTIVRQRLVAQVGLVIDISDSMKDPIPGRFSRPKIDVLLEGVQRMINKLHVDDYITIITFADRVQVLAFAQQVGTFRLGLLHAVEHLHLHRDVPTNIRLMGEGIATALRELRSMPTPANGLRELMVLTDGRPSDESYCYELAEQSEVPFMLGGIGDDYNGTLLNEMARSSRGMAEYIDRAEALDDFVEEVMATI